jgi:hypothetical protein
MHLLMFKENTKWTAMGLNLVLVTNRIACNHLIYSMVNTQDFSYP